MRPSPSPTNDLYHTIAPGIAFTDSLTTVNQKLFNDSHGVWLCKVCILSQGL